MNKGRLFLVACLTLGMVACGKSKEEKATEKAVEDGNAKQSAAVATHSELSTKYNIGFLSDAENYKWADRTPAERKEIRQKLNHQRNAAQDAIAAASRKDTRGGAPELMKILKGTAETFLESLDRFEGQTAKP